MARTAFTLAGVGFRNRVMVGSGTYGYGNESTELADVNGLGAIITKSLSLKPRPGNPPVRIIETAGGMLNSIGLANVGVDRYVSEKLPALKGLDTRIVANIAASSVDEYCAVLERLNGEERVDAFEINVSCPNVKEGGLSFGTNVGMTREITRRLRKLTTKPLIIKLTPNVTFVSEFARAVEEEGADAVSLINTVIGMAIDINRRKAILPTITGGLSGPAIKPIALAKVYECAGAVKIPIIGIGGIMDARDAIEFLMVGATAVQIGTANFIDPGTGIRVAEGIERYCNDHQMDDVQQLVGCLDDDVEASVLKSWI
jgi:dihydroorotate dehydrogenase (NAD+) catalytic subunit